MSGAVRSSPERGGGGRAADVGGGGSLRQPTVYLARRLRREMSPPEALLWIEIRGSRLGFKVRRQHPIGPYVADFFVREAGLAIEIDGEAHERGGRPGADERRDAYLASLGYRTLRIMAADVMQDLDAVLQQIAAEVTSPLHHPSDGPPPRSGEDRR